MSSANTTTTDDASLAELIDDPRSLVRLRILRAARLLLAKRGLSVSMEEIAEAAGLGRRTLFRHFDSHPALLAAALTSALDWYDDQVDQELATDVPLTTWLGGLATRLNEIHRAAGRGLWQLAASDDADLAPELAAVNQRRRTERRRATRAIAAQAWRRAGGTGPCPAVVEDACALTMSSFATHSMVDDYDRTPEHVSAATAALLGALLLSEVERANVAVEAT